MTIRSCLTAVGLLVAGGLLLIVVGFGACVAVRKAQVADAKEWCEQVAVDLEAWRAAHGAYPATLREAGLGGDPPYLCESDLLYGTTPSGGFYLDFPEYWIVGWYYDSKTRTWKRYD